jgi:hypothetical protein
MSSAWIGLGFHPDADQAVVTETGGAPVNEYGRKDENPVTAIITVREPAPAGA